MIPAPDGQTGRLGLLSELALRQEECRVLVRDMHENEDRSYEEAISIASDATEEMIVAVATILFELKHRDPDEVHSVETTDVLWATEFLDHLDTLGWKLERK